MRDGDQDEACDAEGTAAEVELSQVGHLSIDNRHRPPQRRLEHPRGTKASRAKYATLLSRYLRDEGESVSTRLAQVSQRAYSNITVIEAVDKFWTFSTENLSLTVPEPKLIEQEKAERAEGSRATEKARKIETRRAPRRRGPGNRNET